MLNSVETKGTNLAISANLELFARDYLCLDLLREGKTQVSRREVQAQVRERVVLEMDRDRKRLGELNSLDLEMREGEER